MDRLSRLIGGRRRPRPAEQQRDREQGPSSAGGEDDPLHVELNSPAGGLRLRPYPFEIVALLAVAASVLFLRSRGLRIDWQTVEYTVPPLVPVLLRAFATGVGLYSLWAWIREGSPVPAWRRMATLSWLVLSLRLWLAVVLFTYAYFWLKVCVPLVNGSLWDQALWRLDILLHGGISPSIFAVNLVAGTPLAGWIDLWYGRWLTSVSLGIAFFLAFPGALARRRFMLSCVLIWICGSWIYAALPAVGPIYAFNPVWEEVIEELPSADAAQMMLWENYQSVLEGRDGTLRRFNPTRGVAAMPSLHVGVHWLLMLWCRRYTRPLFLPAVLAVFLTLFGSVVTGWHYAVDGYIGILLAQLSYFAALALERAPEAGSEPAGASPGPDGP